MQLMRNEFQYVTIETPMKETGSIFLVSSGFLESREDLLTLKLFQATSQL